jgi:hypothetical protein
MTTPYVIDWPVVVGNVSLTLANLTALRNDIMANPRPSYSVHGHAFQFNEFYRMLTEQIDGCMKQLAQLAPFQIVSQGW